MIPYGQHSISEEDIAAVVETLRSPRITQGPKIADFEARLAEHCQIEHAVVASSGTAALHLACLALELGPGDGLWTSPMSFLASANCGLYCGASVDFVDIDPESGNMNPQALHDKLNLSVAENALPKALIPVHFAGTSCDMPRIAELARGKNIKIIEDASHALGASLEGAPVGNCRYSDMTVFSFHPVKSITCGEGGAITTNSSDLASKLRRLREHGMNRNPAAGSEGPWYYEMQSLGFNYRMNDLQAALGLSQMQRLTNFIARRREIAARYRTELADCPLDFLACPANSESAHHLFVIRPRLDEIRMTRRDIFLALQERGIGVQVHYIPIHLQPYYRRLGFAREDFPAAESFYEKVISLPIYPSLSSGDQDQVIKSLREILD